MSYSNLQGIILNTSPEAMPPLFTHCAGAVDSIFPFLDGSVKVGEEKYGPIITTSTISRPLLSGCRHASRVCNCELVLCPSVYCSLSISEG